MNNKQWNRFWTHIEIGPIDTCWIWQGPSRTRRNGFVYGYFQHNNKRTGAHRLAWESKHGTSPPTDKLVCHTCDTPLCCNPNHLFLGSHQDNMDDAKYKGRIPRGTKVNTNKLTESDIFEIRRSPASCRVLAAQFNVSPSTISLIKKRKTWGWLK